MLNGAQRKDLKKKPTLLFLIGAKIKGLFNSEGKRTSPTPSQISRSLQCPQPMSHELTNNRSTTCDFRFGRH